MANSFRIAYSLEKLHQEEPIDLIQCPATFFESLCYGQLLKPLLNIPLVVKFHENAETYGAIDGNIQPIRRIKSMRRQWFRSYLRQASLSADYWMGVSRHALETTLGYLALDPAAKPHGVSESPIDVVTFSPTEAPAGYLERFGLSGQDTIIFYSGRLIKEKGIHLLVDAFLQRIAPVYPEVKLVIAGEPDYRQPDTAAAIKRQIQGHPAQGQVVFLGRVPYEEMPYWYSACTVFAGPSRCEPFGRVFIEAMACGAAVVGFNRGGPREIMRHGEEGILVDQQTPDALAEGILSLLDHPEYTLTLREKGRQKVLAAYTQEKIVTELVDLYQHLIRQPRPQPSPPYNRSNTPYVHIP
jgi:glycosyltransferase involved in cell wall biosynthesis